MGQQFRKYSKNNYLKFTLSRSPIPHSTCLKPTCSFRFPHTEARDDRSVDIFFKDFFSKSIILDYLHIDFFWRIQFFYGKIIQFFRRPSVSVVFCERRSTRASSTTRFSTRSFPKTLSKWPTAGRGRGRICFKFSTFQKFVHFGFSKILIFLIRMMKKKRKSQEPY